MEWNNNLESFQNAHIFKTQKSKVVVVIVLCDTVYSLLKQYSILV